MIHAIIIAIAIFLVIFAVYLRYLMLIWRIPHRLERARFYMEKNEDEAVRILLSVLSLQKHNIDANWLLAQYNVRKKRFVMALMYLNDILRAAKFTITVTEQDVREMLADLYLRTGNIDKAIAQYNTLQKKYLLSVGVYKRAIRVNLGAGGLTQARELIADAIGHYPEDGELHFMAAQIDYESGRFSSAKERLRKAVDRGYASPEIDLLQGKIYFILSDFSKALHYFQRLPAHYVSDSEVEGIMGQIFYQLKDYGSALHLLQQALDGLEPGNPQMADVMYFLSCAYESSGDIEKAMDLWRRIDQHSRHYNAAHDKLHYYSNVADAPAIRRFVALRLEQYIMAAQKILALLDFRIKSVIYEDDKNLEYLCASKKDNYLFSLYYVVVTRQTVPVDEHFLHQRNQKQIAKRGRYLVVLAPHYSEGAYLFAKDNDFVLMDFDILRHDRDAISFLESLQ